jgi:hypothetical protein
MVYANAFITSTSSPSQIISIGGITKYEGDGATIVGPVMASNSTGTGFAVVGNAVLPVKFLSFNLTRSNTDVIVQWSATNEVNADYYAVERSFDGINWTSVSKLTAQQKLNDVAAYSYIDNQAFGSTVYYRIRQVDRDGIYTYTGTKTIKADVSQTGTVKASVSAGKIILHFEDQIKTSVKVRFISLNGAVLSSQMLIQPFGQVVIPSTIKGHCIIQIIDGQSLNISKQILL